MYIVYGIEEDGSEGELVECKTLAEAAEQIEVWITDIGIDREMPEPGDPPEETKPPRFGIKFNEHHAYPGMDALERHATAKG